MSYKFYIGFVRFFLAVGEPLFKHLRKRGITIIFWTVDSTDDFERAMKFFPHFDGILTDRTTYAASQLQTWAKV